MDKTFTKGLFLIAIFSLLALKAAVAQTVNAPQPAFSLGTTSGCAPLNITPTDQSTIDHSCGTSQYTWMVTGPATISYAAGTTSHSKQPQFIFPATGIYNVQLQITTATCGTATSAPQTVTVSSAPVATLSPNVNICGNNQTFNFNTAAGPTQTFLGGSEVPPAQVQGGNTPVPSPCQWTVSGGGFSFTGNTNANSQYPQINFTDLGTYTITVTNSNACGPTATATQQITFVAPATITSSNSAVACSSTHLNYQPTASDPNSTFTWTVDATKTSASASGYSSGSGTTINDILNNTDPANNATVTYNITAIGSNSCPSNVFVLTVTIPQKTPVASFIQSATAGCGDLPVQFTNNSTPANSNYTWNFGDGSTSSDVSPSHTFAPRTDGKDTVYTVSLIVTTGCGVSQPSFSTVTVRPAIPVAYITPKQLIGCSPFTLAVDNFSPGNNQSYTYYLYNGTDLVQQITMTDKSEVRFTAITVTTTTQFSLYMIATDLCGTTGQSTIIPITVSAANIVSQAFIENNVNKGCAPLMVNLINNSIGGDNYYYTVYDVNHAVVDRRPAGTDPLAYTFNTAGTFYVTITAANSCATVESTPPIRVDVFAAPLPQFSADVTSGCRSLTVNFTNQTPDDATAQATSLAYDWDFGDGSPHETTFTPQPHTYSFKNSPYTVTLTATNLVTNCSNTVTKTDFINIISPPATAFTEKPDSITNIPNYHFSFIDETSGGAVSWKWSFGDGQSSISQNPGHTYIDTGLYKVTLTATSQAGCDSTISHNVRITGVPGELFLPNAFEPDGATTELRTFMAKGSGIKTWHMQVFNNYAQLVWETTKLDDKGAPVDGWDGTFKGSAAPQGVYIWQVSATFINGTDWKGNVINNSLPKRTGVINLIR
jgi:PKD repeat protein